MNNPSEAKLRAAALGVFRKAHSSAVVFRHEDSLRAGVPDTSISWRGVTSWWEFKFGGNTIKWRGAQSAELVRLHSTSIPAFFVVFRETNERGRELFIVPATAGHRNLQTHLYAASWDYQYLLQFIERVHGWSRPYKGARR
jgi:hypothetical protein